MVIHSYENNGFADYILLLPIFVTTGVRHKKRK